MNIGPLKAVDLRKDVQTFGNTLYKVGDGYNRYSRYTLHTASGAKTRPANSSSTLILPLPPHHTHLCVCALRVAPRLPLR